MFGAVLIAVSKVQYRDFEKELHCSAPYPGVWEATMGKLPKLRRIFSIGGYSLDVDLVISVKPAFAEMLLSGRKRVEIRTFCSTKWVGSRICLYATQPAQRLVGEAVIHSIEKGTPAWIWERYGQETGVEKEVFERYVNGYSSVFAIVLDPIKPYRHQIPLAQVEQILQRDLSPPQNYGRLKNNENWASAVTVATLLHGCLSPKAVQLTPGMTLEQ